MKDNRYKILNNLMMAYLNMDADSITGETEIDKMIEYYLEDVGTVLYSELILDIEKFEKDYGFCSVDFMNLKFEEQYPNEWDVGPANEFFELIRKKGSEKFGL